MNMLNGNQLQSSVLVKIDSGLTAELGKPQKKRLVLSKGDARYWLERGRLFKNHGAADYSCRFTTLNRREHFNLGSQNKKTAAAKAAEIYSYNLKRATEHPAATRGNLASGRVRAKK